MAITARGETSIRVRDIQGQRTTALGYNKLIFAHQATGGEATLNLASALTVPTGYAAQGFVQATLGQIAAADIKFYRKNFMLKSSIRGWMTDYDHYVVTSPTLITFLGFVLQPNEIITGVVDKSPAANLVGVDNVARPMTGTLTIGQITFAVGWPFEVNKYPTSQTGSVLVVMDGVVLERCVGNVIGGVGDYIESVAGTGVGNTITFKNAPFLAAKKIQIIPIMGVGVAPSASLIAYAENVNARIEAMVPDLAGLMSVPRSKYDVGTSAADLADFGTRLLTLEEKGVPEWNVAIPYAVGAVVRNATGDLYRCIFASLGFVLTNTTYWLALRAAGIGSVPVGSVIATFPHMTGAYSCANKANAGADLLGYVLCSGTLAERTVAAGQTIVQGRVVPDISDNRFIMGSVSSSATPGGNNSPTISVSGSVTMPAHTHNLTNLGGAYYYAEYNANSINSIYNISGPNISSPGFTSITSLATMGLAGTLSGGSLALLGTTAGISSSPAVGFTSTGSNDTRPQYVSAVFIMRIK